MIGYTDMMETIAITTEFIRLQDLLKLAGLTATGGEAKMLVQDGQAAVNGQICTQRGKKIRPGDVVRFQGRELQVTYAP